MRRMRMMRWMLRLTRRRRRSTHPVVVALPTTVPSAEETEPFETDESAATPPPHPAYRVTALQGQVMTLQGQVTALQGQQGPARGPAPPELPEEAGSSS
ncbi:hypothetical protein Tco_0441021 [Tanacetum coccineum]